MVSPNSINVLSIVGPTASQKSLLALHLAKRFKGEIINADSRQFYIEMNVGTAKPTVQEQQSVPHHLIDCAHIDDAWDVARFVKSAQDLIMDIHSRNRVPIVVGGTGLYTRALIWGIDSIPPIPDDLKLALKTECQQHGIQYMHQKLASLDAEGAQRILPQDTQRIMRALEVVLHTHKPLHSFWQENKVSKYQNLRFAIDWPREVLYQRIDERVVEMFAKGLKSEVQNLILNFPNNSVLSKTIGYQEWMQNGFDDEAYVLKMIQQNTRQFAKRQLTWFRKETDITWLTPDRLTEAENHVTEFLK